MKRKKRISKRILLLVLGGLLIISVFYIFLVKAESNKLPHQYASQEEGNRMGRSSDHWRLWYLTLRIDKNTYLPREMLYLSSWKW